MCGLTDNSVPGDWRLPNRNELLSLVDVSKSIPALPEGHPFANVVEEHYWTSTMADYNRPAEAWYLYMYDGSVRYEPKYASDNYAWPVRSAK